MSAEPVIARRPRRLGWSQALAIRTMQKPGMEVWSPTSPWMVRGSIYYTREVMERLFVRGLVEAIGPRTYRITDAGRAWKTY